VAPFKPLRRHLPLPVPISFSWFLRRESALGLLPFFSICFDLRRKAVFFSRGRKVAGGFGDVEF